MCPVFYFGPIGSLADTFQMTISTKLSSTNFLRQFRTDESSGSLVKLSSVQFMEVWEHYDKDGNIHFTTFLECARLCP